MKSVYLSAEHESFRSSVRRFIDEEVAPHAEEWEAARRIPREVFSRMGGLGFLGISFPEAYGGTGADLFFGMVFLEELSRSRMGGFCAAVGVQQFMATQHIYRYGSEDLKQRYLVPSIAGTIVGGLAVTEPDTGSDVAAIQTRAARDGDAYMVTGAKTFITNGCDGDFLTVAVKTIPDSGAEGISLLVIDTRAPGVTVARRLDKLGWHSSDTAELHFDAVRVPISQLIGQENMGFVYLMEAFQLERLVGAAIAVGSAALCIDETVAYLKTRHAFGKPLARFPVLTHRLAALAAELEAARQLTYHAAWLLETSQPAVRECSMAKLVATELSKRTADECLQCFGGYGYTEEYPISRYYRDARAGTIVAGTSDIMREIIARIMIEGEQPASKRTATQGGLANHAATVAEPAARGTIPERPATVETLIRSLPDRLRADKIADWRSRFHFRLEGAHQAEWTVSIEEGRCRVEPGLMGEPDCVVEMGADTYVGIETGAVNAQVAFMLGKVKVSNLQQMIRYAQAFRRISP